MEPTFRDGLLFNLDILDAFLRPYTGGSTQLHLGSLVSAVCDDLAAQKLSMAKEKDLCVCVCVCLFLSLQTSLNVLDAAKP